MLRMSYRSDNRRASTVVHIVKYTGVFLIIFFKILGTHRLLFGLWLFPINFPHFRNLFMVPSHDFHGLTANMAQLVCHGVTGRTAQMTCHDVIGRTAQMNGHDVTGRTAQLTCHDVTGSTGQLICRTVNRCVAQLICIVD